MFSISIPLMSSPVLPLCKGSVSRSFVGVWVCGDPPGCFASLLKFAGDEGLQDGRRPMQAKVPISFEWGNVASALVHDMRNPSLSIHF